jgi:hypothetical protein
MTMPDTDSTSQDIAVQDPAQSDLDTIDTPTHLAGLTGKRRLFVEGMGFLGLNMKAAAKHAGMTERQAYNLIRMPEILKAIETETKVLRTSARPRAIRNLMAIGDQRRNLTAAVQANGKLMAEPDANRTQINVSVTPGYVIDLSDVPRQRVIEHDEGEVIRVDDGATEPVSAEDVE